MESGGRREHDAPCDHRALKNLSRASTSDSEKHANPPGREGGRLTAVPVPTGKLNLG